MALGIMLGVAAQPCFPARVASAQVESSEAIQRARELFKKSAQSYRDGRFQEAIDLLNEAYGLDPKPVLVYNLARAYEGLGDTPRAIEAYRRYLDQDPTTADRGALEQRIATLERQQREREALERAAAARAAPPKEKRAAPVPEPSSGPSPAPWVVAGVGVVGVGAGLVLGALARGRHEDAVNEPGALPALELQAQAESWATGATVALIVGGAVTAGGAIWGIVDLTSQRRSEPAVSASSRRIRLGLAGLSVVVQGQL